MKEKRENIFMVAGMVKGTIRDIRMEDEKRKSWQEKEKTKRKEKREKTIIMTGMVKGTIRDVRMEDEKRKGDRKKKRPKGKKKKRKNYSDRNSKRKEGRSTN